MSALPARSIVEALVVVLRSRNTDVRAYQRRCGCFGTFALRPTTGCDERIHKHALDPPYCERDEL